MSYFFPMHHIPKKCKTCLKDYIATFKQKYCSDQCSPHKYKPKKKTVIKESDENEMD